MTDEQHEKQRLAQQQADAGQRVKAFLADDAVKAAFIELEKRYFAEFKKAATPADREQLHARVRALDELFTTVLGVVDSGTIAQHTLDTVKQQETRQRTPRR